MLRRARDICIEKHKRDGRKPEIRLFFENNLTTVRHCSSFMRLFIFLSFIFPILKTCVWRKYKEIDLRNSCKKAFSTLIYPSRRQNRVERDKCFNRIRCRRDGRRVEGEHESAESIFPPGLPAKTNKKSARQILSPFKQDQPGESKPLRRLFLLRNPI